MEAGPSHACWGLLHLPGWPRHSTVTRTTDDSHTSLPVRRATVGVPAGIRHAFVRNLIALICKLKIMMHILHYLLPRMKGEDTEKAPGKSRQQGQQRAAWGFTPSSDCHSPSF